MKQRRSWRPGWAIARDQVKADEEALLNSIRANPEDKPGRLAYADWLDERGDARGKFLRVQLAVRALSPDHARRLSGEQRLSSLRKGLDPDWLVVVEPERAHLYKHQAPAARLLCQCVTPHHKSEPWSELRLHTEPQDTESDAWKRLLDRIEEAAEDGREEFAPVRNLDPSDWEWIVTLPPSIVNLKAVRHLNLYGSSLVRIPPEIGAMSGLENFDPYTSYRLHWFPYKITRCRKLTQSTVSTWALYGNRKFRPPFPRLEPGPTPEVQGEGKTMSPEDCNPWPTRSCSVCDRPFEDRQLHRVWISLRVATDTLPLLVNACSQECVRRLPRPKADCVRSPHQGGLEVQQPSYRRRGFFHFLRKS